MFPYNCAISNIIRDAEKKGGRKGKIILSRAITIMQPNDWLCFDGNENKSATYRTNLEFLYFLIYTMCIKLNKTQIRMMHLIQISIPMNKVF